MKNSLANASDRDLIATLAEMSKHSVKAACIFTALTEDTWFQAVVELRNRYNRREIDAGMVCEKSPRSASGRVSHAGSVEIDSDRWKAWFYRNRIPLCHVGPIVGLSGPWANAIAFRGRASFSTLDRLCAAMEVSLDQFLYEVGSDRERERVIACR